MVMKRAPSITSAEMRAQVMKAEVEQVHTMDKKNNIFSNFSRKTLLLPLHYLPYTQDYTNHWPLTWTNSNDIFQLFMISGPNETRYGERNEK